MNQLSENFEGDGLRDLFNGAIDRLKGFYRGTRLDFPPNERSLLKMYGSVDIFEITLFRAPIHRMLDKVLNVISVGKWDNLKNENNFDRMFHLYMVIKLANGHMIRLEKNHVVNISNSFKIESDAEYQNISLQGKKLTLNELLQNTIQSVGQKQVFVYSPWKENCQRFLLDILQSNGLVTEQAQHFIYQDISNLVQKLPWYTKMIGQKTTDLAHKADILLHGQALHKL